MQLAPIVTRLQTISELGNRVMAARDMETAIDYVATKTPAGAASAVVFAPRESAEPSDLIAGGVRHRVTSTFGVMTCIRYAGNAELAYEQLDAMRDDLFALLLGWAPDSNHRELQFASGELAHSDVGIIIWHDEYRTEHYIESQ